MDRAEKTRTFQINDIEAFREQLTRLCSHNPNYDLTKRELIGKGLVGVRVYADVYPCEEVSLAEGSYAADSDQCFPKDALMQGDTLASPCLLVQVSGESVGYIRKADYPVIKEWLDQGLIDSLSLELHGGGYRLLFEDEVLEEGNAGLFGLLTVTVHEPEKKADASETGTMHYISTTYDTRLREDDGRRGNAALVLALLLGAFYLGFSIPYWIMVRRGLITAASYLGGDLPNDLLNPHIALVIAALAVTLVSFFLKNGIFPLLGAALFMGSAWSLPGLALFTTLPALLSVTAAFKKKPRGAFTAVKVVFLLAVLGAAGWFLRDTALYVWNNRSFMVRPTGTEDVLTPAAIGDDGLGFAYDDEDGVTFDDDDLDDDDDDDYDEDDGDFESFGNQMGF